MLVRQKTGAGETAAAVTAVSFSDPGSDDMDIPGVADQYYSQEIWLRLYQESESLVYALKCYGAGSMPAGITVWVKTAGSYSTPSVPADVSAFTQLTDYDSSSSLELDTNSAYTTTGDIGKYVVLVGELDKGTTAGLKIGQDIVFAWEAA